MYTYQRERLHRYADVNSSLLLYTETKLCKPGSIYAYIHKSKRNDNHLQREHRSVEKHITCNDHTKNIAARTSKSKYMDRETTERGTAIKPLRNARKRQALNQRRSTKSSAHERKMKNHSLVYASTTTATHHRQLIAYQQTVEQRSDNR